MRLFELFNLESSMCNPRIILFVCELGEFHFQSAGQPGFESALAFTEKRLISTKPNLVVKREFDEQNYKVVEIEYLEQNINFSKEAISLGIGWHNEKETGRFGPFLMAQLKAEEAKSRDMEQWF